MGSHGSGILGLIVTADDLGLSEDRDSGILEAFHKGIVKTSSLLVMGKHSKQAAMLAKAAGLTLGLHINLTEGPAASPVEKVPSLLTLSKSWWPGDHVGEEKLEFRGKNGLRQALSRGEISMVEVASEVDAQLDLFVQITGQAPLHIDGHQHCHVLPGIAAVIARIAAKYQVRCVRIPHEDEQYFHYVQPPERRRFFAEVSSQASAARCIYAEEGLFSPAYFAGFGLMGQDCTSENLKHILEHVCTCVMKKGSARAANVHSCDDDKKTEPHEDSKDAMIAWEARGAAAVCELMCHVGHGSREGDDFNKSSERWWELSVLTSPDTASMLHRMHVHLISIAQLIAAHDRLHARDGLSKGVLQGADVAIKNSDRHVGHDSDDDKTQNDEAEKRSRGREGRLLVLASTTEATGNSVTAARYMILLGGTDVNVFVHEDAKRQVMRAALDGARCVASFSANMLDKVRGALAYTGPSVLMPQAVDKPDLTMHHGVAPLRGIPAGAHVFLMPCGLRPVKDPEFLVDAFRAWHLEDSRVLLVIVGPLLDKDCATHLFDRINRGNNATDSHVKEQKCVCTEDEDAGLVSCPGVLYHPHVPREALLEELKRATAVLNSSKSEGMSNTLLEAMAYGVPVVARAVPGNLELVRHGSTGLLYVTPEECIAQCKALIHDSTGLASRLTASASAYLSQHHSVRNEIRALQCALSYVKT